LKFGDGLEYVGAYAVGYLPELTKITFGASQNVTIGQQAFYIFVFKNTLKNLDENHQGFLLP